MMGWSQLQRLKPNPILNRRGAVSVSRRSLLRGAGTIAIGLPFLPELAPAAANAAGDAPLRFMTLFFGLGLDPAWQRDFSSALEPLSSVADQLSVFSVDVPQASGGAHCETGTIIFTGERHPNESTAGGPSLDQLLRQELCPEGVTLASGLWWRRGACDGQALRVFNPDGSPRPPIKRPSEVFQTLFGSFEPEPVTPGDATERERDRRVARSVLDTVLEQYQDLLAPTSYLGSQSKQKIELHLQSIREIERELAPGDALVDPPASCSVPDAPNDPDIADYDRFTYGTGDGAPEIAWEDVEQVFRLHADLWTLGLRCNRVQFGNLMFESAGGHTNLTGTYSALGRSTNFPGTSQHDSYFHDNQPGDAELYQHFSMRNLAYFLERLADPEFTEENDQTLLHNTGVLIGTEYGWNHSKTDVFHALVGGGGRFRPGFYNDLNLNCIDVYNMIAEAYGVEAHIGTLTGVDSQGDASSARA